METDPNKHLPEATANWLSDLHKSRTLEGRTTKLLDMADTSNYIEEIKQSMCAYIVSKDFKLMTKGGKIGWLWTMTGLIEYISKLDQK